MKIIAITGSPMGANSCIGRLTNIALESLGVRRILFSRILLATHTGILTSKRSTVPYETTSLHLERSPTTPARRAGNSNLQFTIYK